MVGAANLHKNFDIDNKLYYDNKPESYRPDRPPIQTVSFHISSLLLKINENIRRKICKQCKDIYSKRSR